MSLKIATESLSREEMRMITGGSGGGTCTLTCQHWGRGMEVSHCNGTVVWFYCGTEEGAHTCNCN
jgi:hypothetical protein